MTDATDPAFFRLLEDSYKRLLSRPPPFMAGCDSDGPMWLYSKSAVCVLAHNTDADPLFVYANKAAQRLFEYDWSEMVGMPSRFSAEAPNRAERQRLLDAVARDGYVTDYTGVRSQNPAAGSASKIAFYGSCATPTACSTASQQPSIVGRSGNIAD